MKYVSPTEFNATTGLKKSIEQVKKMWINFQRPLKAKRSAYEAGKHKTGGGENEAPAPTDEENYILDVASNDPTLIKTSIWDSNVTNSAKAGHHKQLEACD